MSGVEAVSFGDVVLLSWEVGLAVSEGVSSGPVVREQEQLMLFGVGVAVEHGSCSLSDLKICFARDIGLGNLHEKVCLILKYALSGRKG